MSTASRILLELSDLEHELQRIVRAIDAGATNLTDVRRAIEHIRSTEIREIDRLTRTITSELRRATS